MNIFKRLFGFKSDSPKTKTSRSDKRYETAILMGLTHRKSQQYAVATAIEEFAEAHSRKIKELPNLTFTSDGSLIHITILIKDDAEGMRLNSDLQKRLIAHGIKWD